MEKGESLEAFGARVRECMMKVVADPDNPALVEQIDGFAKEVFTNNIPVEIMGPTMAREPATLAQAINHDIIIMIQILLNAVLAMLVFSVEAPTTNDLPLEGNREQHQGVIFEYYTPTTPH
ncbi:hypothetical protein GE061_011547 [Apolygus lucorum]|uniref:Uncharacterized protein n=1 Tax=Apolygus lucorum TaxID=248454 RepID=A0A8S9Y1U2_APOLU|nr:hypothetical protein GE061_011547 [Apolygus lucorum]